MDFGFVSLVLIVVEDVGRVAFGGSASSPAGLCVGLRAATVFERPRLNTPEFGLVLVPGADVVMPTVPARALVAIDEAPGLGSRLGDMVRGPSDIDAEAEVTGPLGLVSRALPAMAGNTSFSPSFLCALPRPAVGCRRERDRFSPVAEDEDDMVSR